MQYFSLLICRTKTSTIILGYVFLWNTYGPICGICIWHLWKLRGLLYGRSLYKSVCAELENLHAVCVNIRVGVWCANVRSLLASIEGIRTRLIQPDMTTSKPLAFTCIHCIKPPLTMKYLISKMTRGWYFPLMNYFLFTHFVILLATRLVYMVLWRM